MHGNVRPLFVKRYGGFFLPDVLKYGMTNKRIKKIMLKNVA
jgi:uncharacterized protein YqkB